MHFPFLEYRVQSIEYRYGGFCYVSLHKIFNYNYATKLIIDLKIIKLNINFI